MSGFRYNPPLVLDFDGSVLPVADSEIRVPLAGWQEAIRFGCSLKDYAALETHLRACLPQAHGPVYTGSGDYHHVSLFLLGALAEKAGLGRDSLTVVVLDNHPDAMRYPFGLHCGSWAAHACALSFVRHVHVVGICSPDITLKHAWENRLGPFLRRRLTYWSIGKSAGWLRAIGRGDYARSFDGPDSLVERFLPVLHGADRVYLSIDKDVFSREELETDWDQGLFRFGHVREVVEACAARLSGCDICGELSEPYSYQSRFKRLLSRLDGQSGNRRDGFERLRQRQRDCNSSLLALLRGMNGVS